MVDRVNRVAPGIALLSRYDRSWLRSDALASLSLWAVLVPQAMAYAQLAGLQPVAGLYTALAAMLLYAVLGTSHYLNVGPESSVGILIAGSLALLPNSDDPSRYAALAAMLAILTGGFLILGYVLRLGVVTRLLSAPVLTGYIAGAAIVIMTSQLSRIFGFRVDPDEYPLVVGGVVTHLSRTNAAALAIGVGTAVVVAVLKLISRRLPAALIGLVLATVVVAIAGLADQLDTVGKVAAGLPSPGLPDVGLKDIRDLLVPALSVAMLVFSGSILTARSLAARNREDVDSNREFLGLAAANLGAGLVGGFPANASDSRSSVVAESRAKSQMVGYIGAVLLLITLLFLTPLLHDVPSAALGGVILVTAIGLIDLKEMRRLWWVHRTDFALMAITLGGVLLLGVLGGIVVGVIASLLAMVRKTIQPTTAVLGLVEGTATYRDVAHFEDAETLPGLVVYRFDAPLFFGNADVFRDQIRELVRGGDPPVRCVIVNAEGVTDLDTTGIGVLGRLLDDLEDAGVQLVMARLRTPLRELLGTTGVEERIGPENFHLRVEGAVRAFRTSGAGPPI